jgi:HSP20 family protein
MCPSGLRFHFLFEEHSMSTLQNGCTRGTGLFGRNLDEVWNHLFFERERTGSGSFMPRVNVAEADDAWELVFELPGIAADAINIEYQDDVLTVTGERKFDESRAAEKKFHRVEQRFGTFSRSFRLPDVDGEKITAHCVNGELAVRAPKMPAVVARKIPVMARPADA